MKEIRGDLFDCRTYQTSLPRACLGGFDVIKVPDAICITTNGFVKRNGYAVMGRGCARAAAEKEPQLAVILGHLIKTNGAHKVHRLYEFAHPGSNNNFTFDLLAFPVKPAGIYLGPALIKEFPDYPERFIVKHMRNKFCAGDTVPGWACKAELSIISHSASQLADLANEYGWDVVVLPRPGCGAGELKWSQVKPVLEQHLDDRFYAITY